MRKYYNDGEAIIRRAGVLLSNNCSHSGQYTRTRTHRHTDTHKIDYIRAFFTLHTQLDDSVVSDTKCFRIQQH